jgi:hypothetical protein
VDVVFAHVPQCMALSAKEIHGLVGVVGRELRPGGTFVHAVRHIGDTLADGGASHAAPSEGRRSGVLPGQWEVVRCHHAVHADPAVGGGVGEATSRGGSVRGRPR